MKKAILLIGLAAILLTTMILPVMGYEWDMGVQVGDWFTYETELIKWETDGVPFPPWWNPGLAALNDTDYVTYTVTAIDADWVNFTEYRMWNNGSDFTTTLDYNLTAGPGWMVIGANLTEGEEVRGETQFYGPMYLNASRMRDYNNSVTREVNVLNYTGFGIDNEYNFDAMTGILVYHLTGGPEVFDFQVSAYVDYWARMELTDSSVEELEIVPDMTGVILLLTMMSITIPIVLLRKRKRLNI
jgi:hypothetical protein